MNNMNPAGENAIQKFEYEGNSIAFANGENVMVNATQMAKKFGKHASDWLRLKSTKDFLDELTKMRSMEDLGTGISVPTDLVQVTNGGKNYGTWMHEDVALEFARWLSPKFAIWCNARIKELVRTGFTTATPQAQQRTELEVMTEAFRILNSRCEQKDAQIETLEKENARLRTEASRSSQPYTYTGPTHTFTEVALSLGFRRVTDFLNWAVGAGILIRYDGRCMPAAQYRDRGFFWHRTCTVATPFGSYERKTYSVVTESGLDMFAAELAAHTEEGGEL